MYKIELLTAPTVDPISVSDAKIHSRIFGTDTDDYISGLITASRIKFETESGYYLSQAEYKVTTKRTFCRSWYDWNETASLFYYILPLRPVMQVESVNSLILNTDYTVSIDALTGQATIHFLTDIDGDIVITFKVGFPNPSGDDPSTAPALAKHALKSLVSHWFENRESYQAGSSIKTTPASYQSILQSYRLA